MTNSLRSRLFRHAGFVGSAMMGFSVVSLANEAFEMGWVEPARRLLEQYVVIREAMESIVSPAIAGFIELMSYLLQRPVSLLPNWADVFLLMSVYLGSRIKAYLGQKKFIRSALMAGVATFICLGSTISLIPRGDPLSRLYLSSAYPFFGFFAYDIIYACIGASLDRRTSVSWSSEFLRHIYFSLPLNFACLSLAFTMAYLLPSSGLLTDEIYVISLVLNYLLISLYWSGMSYAHARRRENRQLGETIAKRFWRSSATSVSMHVGIVIWSSLLFILGNAGLKELGMSAAQV